MDETTRSATPSCLAGAEVEDALHAQLRPLIRALIEQLVRAELDGVLGVQRYARGGGRRRGYRHATRERVLTTSVGATALTVPRARLFAAAGPATHEWHSALLPRYHRRARAVDATVMGAYVAGANTRRVRSALQPL